MSSTHNPWPTTGSIAAEICEYGRFHNEAFNPNPISLKIGMFKWDISLFEEHGTNPFTLTKIDRRSGLEIVRFRAFSWGKFDKEAVTVPDRGTEPVFVPGNEVTLTDNPEDEEQAEFLRDLVFGGIDALLRDR